MFNIFNSPMLKSLRRTFRPPTLITGGDGSPAPFPLPLPGGLPEPDAVFGAESSTPPVAPPPIMVQPEPLQFTTSPGDGTPPKPMPLPSFDTAAPSMVPTNATLPTSGIPSVTVPLGNAASRPQEAAAPSRVPSVTVPLGKTAEQTPRELRKVTDDPLIGGIAKALQQGGQPPKAEARIRTPGETIRARQEMEREDSEATRKAVEAFDDTELGLERRNIQREQVNEFYDDIDRIAAADPRERSKLRRELKDRLLEAEAREEIPSSIHRKLVRETDAAGEPRLAVGAGKNGLLSERQLGRLSDEELKTLIKSEKEQERLLGMVPDTGNAEFVAGLAGGAAAREDKKASDKPRMSGRSRRILTGIGRVATPLGALNMTLKGMRGLTTERIGQLQGEWKRRQNL